MKFLRMGSIRDYKAAKVFVESEGAAL